MKRFFVIFAVLTAMVFMVGCGGDSNENNENNGNESGNNEDNSQGCTSGEFKCVGNESYYCNSLGSWVYDARCENGCSSLTGKCITNSGGDNNDTDSGDFSDSANDNTDSDTNTNTETDPCTEEGAFRCNGNLQQECTYGYWRTLVECEYDCDPVTQKCLGATECKTGTYECIAGNSSYCNNNFWEIKEVCQYGCSEGKCLPEDCNTTRIYTCGDSKESGFSYASYYCEYGSWHYDKTCQGDCDKSTGKCKAVCSSDEYKCEGNDSMRCKDGFWTNYITSCPYGCNSSTGKCNCATIDGKTWSELASKTWEEANDYCDNLVECGYSDWHLPTISELRTLIQNCSKTETGGECGVTDSCLSYSECYNNACKGCDYDSGKYSKLGDTVFYLWSSSVRSDTSVSAWYVGFDSGLVGSSPKFNTHSFRCVR